MGLLDDAIREHLELKRQHGADPSELERAEQEALGPVRRKPIEPQDEFDDHVADEEPGVADEHEYPIQDEDYADVVEPDKRGAFGEDDRLIARGNGEGGTGLSEAEYEEYYDEEYYDDEEGEESEEPFPEEVSPRPRYESEPPDSAGQARNHPTAAHRASVPPESAPPTQAASPEPAESEPDEETVEYDVEDALHSRPRRRSRRSKSRREPSPEPGEDVLEETPEFLQDAPEHDRLWFEQRPPRDFDFDG